MKNLCQKWKVKTDFSRRLQAVRNWDCWVFGNHWRTA